jgi:LCP family protein required for cell wall assembly
MKNKSQANTIESANQNIAERTASLARRSPIDMSLPGDTSPNLVIAHIASKKWRRVRKVATRSLAVSLLLALTLGGLLISQGNLKMHKVFRGGEGTASALVPTKSLSLLNGENSGRVNILLLGRDGGSGKNADVTNSMMLASIDTLNHTATLISLPGDLWVNASNLGVMKLDTVYQNSEFKHDGNSITGNTSTQTLEAGFGSADKTISQVMGINIDYNVITNLQAFQQAVDTVGGVTIDVPTSLSDQTMAWQNNHNPNLVPAGTQTLTGKQAYLYAASKETTSDFARAQRQRQVMSALVDKIMSIGTYSDPLKLESLINAFGNNVETDLSVSNAKDLYTVIKSISSSNIASTDLNTAPNQLVTNGNVNGLAVVLPQAGLFNYYNIKHFVSLQLKNPYLTQENAKVLILNGTDTAGLATTMGDLLKSHDYNVIGEANAPSSNWAETSLYNVTKSNPHTEKMLEKSLGVKVANKTLNKSIPTDGADFVIIIGSNEANNSQTQAN